MRKRQKNSRFHVYSNFVVVAHVGKWFRQHVTLVFFRQLICYNSELASERFAYVRLPRTFYQWVVVRFDIAAKCANFLHLALSKRATADRENLTASIGAENLPRCVFPLRSDYLLCRPVDSHMYARKNGFHCAIGLISFAFRDKITSSVTPGISTCDSNHTRCDWDTLLLNDVSPEENREVAPKNWFHIEVNQFVCNCNEKGVPIHYC